LHSDNADFVSVDKRGGVVGIRGTGFGRAGLDGGLAGGCDADLQFVAGGRCEVFFLRASGEECLNHDARDYKICLLFKIPFHVCFCFVCYCPIAVKYKKRVAFLKLVYTLLSFE
jgi:hypothetical protein